MKKIINLCFIIFLLLPVCACGKDATSQGRILVLGFQSRTISELQDRLLRESIMRELRKQDYPIVPVMEIERFFREHNGGIRRIKSSQMQDLCGELNAGYSVSGTITSYRGKSIVKYLIYDRMKDTMHRYTIQLNSKIELDQYFKTVTDDIIKKIGKLIHN